MESEIYLSYKDYAGVVSWSQEDNCYHGRIIGITDLVLFEADEQNGLQQAFEEAVEDYLETKQP